MYPPLQLHDLNLQIYDEQLCLLISLYLKMYTNSIICSSIQTIAQWKPMDTSHKIVIKEFYADFLGLWVFLKANNYFRETHYTFCLTGQ